MPRSSPPAPARPRLPPRAAARFGGILGGATGTVVGTFGSTFYAIYFDAIKLGKDHYRATMTAILLTLSLARGTGYFVFGGGFMPVGLMPAAVIGVLSWTPFPYIIDLPVEALLGRLSGPALHAALLHQWTWILLLVGLSRLLWHRGLRRYDAAGL